MPVKHIGITAEAMNDRARQAKEKREKKLRETIIGCIEANADCGLTSLDVGEITDEILKELEEAGFKHHPLSYSIRISWK